YDKDVRDFCRKVDLQYRLLCNDLKGRFAVILIPHDTTEEEFKQALSIINVSFPILLREFVENHPFMRYKQQVVEIVIIDRDGREVTRGGLKTVAEIRSLLQQGQ
ncbi:MAG: hypothetical protein QXH91_04595, partial [Candidatus Bathyarchaeia archaeon]